MTDHGGARRRGKRGGRGGERVGVPWGGAARTGGFGPWLLGSVLLLLCVLCA
jgi:hypothetical protein